MAVDNAGNVVTSTDPTAGANAWSVANVDSPNVISEVACTVASACVAVDDMGNVLTSANPTARSWAVANVDGTNQFSGISYGGSLCAAVDTAGNVVTSAKPTGGPAAWAVTPFDLGNVPSAISCPKSTYCAAVDGSGAVVESTNPTGGPSAWQSMKAGAAIPLFGVTCPSLSFCLAVDSAGRAIVETPAAPPVTLTITPAPTARSGSVTGTGINCPGNVHQLLRARNRGHANCHPELRLRVHRLDWRRLQRDRHLRRDPRTEQDRHGEVHADSYADRLGSRSGRRVGSTAPACCVRRRITREQWSP
jgi:hypothetical protein